MKENKMTTQIEKTKNSCGFKVPNSDVIWRVEQYKSNGVMAIVESVSEDLKSIYVNNRFFTEEDLKDAIFYKMTPINK